MDSLNAKGKNGHTQLMDAAKAGQLDQITDLLQRGADITASSDKGKTALHYAAANGQTAAVKLLVEKMPKLMPVTTKDIHPSCWRQFMAVT